MANTNDDGGTNFGMQPSAQGAASDEERPEGTSMTDRQQRGDKAGSQQELQMGQKAPLPGERGEDNAQEQSGQTSAQQGQATPLSEGAEGHEGPAGAQEGRS